MQTRVSGWSETWRVLAYTLAIALGFIALSRLQLALFSLPGTAQLLQRSGLMEPRDEGALLQRAHAVAEASRQALQRLPPGHRRSALHLGYELGYISQTVGAYATSPPEAQAVAVQHAEAHRLRAQELAQGLGLGAVQALPVRNLREFNQLTQRYEDDENGLARRIESQMSPLHRHLYLLGVHLGGEAARVESSAGRFALPPAAPIRRHAVLAGIGPEHWRALAQEPQNETPAQVLQRYRAALQALDAEVARQDAAGGAPPAR